MQDFTIDGEAIADPDDDVYFKDAYRDIALYALGGRHQNLFFGIVSDKVVFQSERFPVALCVFFSGITSKFCRTYR